MSFFEWRYNRAKFWSYNIVLNIISGLLVAWLLFLMVEQWYSMLIYLIYLIYFLWFIFWLKIIIKRLHDLDKTGWMSLLMFVPLANIYLVIICLFFKWTDWENKYGKDPLKKEITKEL